MTSKTVAVTGKVIDANGLAVLAGRIDYRRPGAPWATTRIDYDGTYEVLDDGPGPYELIATQSNGPADRHEDAREFEAPD